MELSRIAAKQKRAKDWQDLLEREVSDRGLRHAIEANLREYRKILTSCWEKESITPAQDSALEDLERKLQQLSEEARLKAGYA